MLPAVMAVVLTFGLLTAAGADAHTTLTTLRPDRLKATLAKAADFCERKHRPDSALYYFTSVGASYSPDLSKEDKEICVRAMLGKWVVLFGYYYDYPQAFEALLRAREICDAEGLDLPRVDVSMAGMYQSLAQASGDNALNDSATYYYRRSISSSLSPKHYDVADLAFTNAFQIVTETGDHAGTERLWKAYSRIPEDPKIVRRSFNRAMYRAYSISRGGDFPAAVSLVDSTVAAIPDTTIYNRMRIIGMLYSARLSSRASDYATAAATVRRAIGISERLDMLDAQAEGYTLLSQIMEHAGDQVRAKEYRLKSIALSDSISYHSNLLKVDELRYLYAAGKADANLARVDAERRQRGTIMVFLSLLVVVAALFSLLIWRKNKKLREQMRVLYLRSIEGLQESIPTAAEESETPQEQGQEECEEKYQGSSLSEEARDDLARRIELFAKESPEIYSPDFTVARMAQALDTNPKYVSQTINAIFGCNFNIYVNRIRVREAIRRFNTDPSWSRLTIEGAAAEVGFKSRSTFINSFKRETGLTPSEYKKQVELARKSPNL